MFLLYISGALLLGWLLGSKEAANFFGHSVISRMLGFFKISLFASFFIVLGAVWKGENTSNTVANFGQIPSPTASFVVALASGIAVIILYKLQFQHSVIQAVIGALLGWMLFAGNFNEFKNIYPIIIVWLIAPILSGIFAALFYLIVKRLLKQLKIHIVILDSYIRIGIIISVAFAAFGFGANNIGSIVGFYTNSAPDFQFNFDIIQISGNQLLFFIGALAIIAGIFTHRKINSTDRNENLITMMPETGIVLIFSQALVLFLFSSNGFSTLLDSLGLFSIPLIPISIYHLSVGSLLGIGVVKGGNEFEYKSIASIVGGMFSTLIFAAILSFFLLFIAKNAIGVSDLGTTTHLINADNHIKTTSIHDVNGVGLVWFLVALLLLTVLGLIFSYYHKQRRLWKNATVRLNNERKEHNAVIHALTEANLKAITLENSYLNNKLEFKHREMVSYALNIVEQQDYLAQIHHKLKEIRGINNVDELHHRINDLLLSIKQAFCEILI